MSSDTYPYNFGNPVELNRYVYAANNPATFEDPSGYGLTAYGAISAIITGAVTGGAIGGFGGGITAIGLWHLSTSGACGAKQQAYFMDNNIQFADFVMTGFLNGVGFGLVSGATFGLASVFGMGALVSTAIFWGDIALDQATQQMENDPNSCNASLLLATAVFSLYGVLRSASPHTPTGSQDTPDSVKIPVEVDEVPLGSNSSSLPLDFYVTPDGDAIPATAYKYVGDDWRFLQSAIDNGSLPADPNGTYVTFDGNYTPAQAQSALQLPMEDGVYVSNARIRIEFDTLQFIDNINIPDGLHGTNGIPEPLCCTYSDWGWGAGGGTQATTTSPINISRIVNIVTGAILYESP